MTPLAFSRLHINENICPYKIVNGELQFKDNGIVTISGYIEKQRTHDYSKFNISWILFNHYQFGEDLNEIPPEMIKNVSSKKLPYWKIFDFFGLSKTRELICIEVFDGINLYEKISINTMSNNIKRYWMSDEKQVGKPSENGFGYNCFHVCHAEAEKILGKGLYSYYF